MLKLIPILLVVLCGCSQFRPFIYVHADKSSEPKPRAKAVAVSYAESVFQERFMSVTGIVAFVMFTGPVDAITLGQAHATETLNDAVYTPRDRTVARQANSKYEKLLGSFDVHADFNRAVTAAAGRCRAYDLSIPTDPVVNGTVIDVLKDPAIRNGTKSPAVLGEALRQRLARAKRPYALGLKFSYGLGARGGKEQWGFTKTYRPFVKLIGVMIDVESGKMVWRNFLIAFSDQVYRGGDSDDEEIDGGRLASEFAEINKALASRLVDCLNGKPVTDMPYLVGLSTSLDFTF